MQYFTVILDKENIQITILRLETNKRLETK